ncbi:MAG: ribonuclease H-like domain-containing protein [Desulfobulbaceae bacterium]|nr:ribonuclease H-like domain-containing protein [Desulfobulbaceae bacterium]
MLPNTFIHLQGIGLKRELDLWQTGTLNWDDFMGNRPDAIPPARAAYIIEALEESRSNLATCPGYFTKLLPASQHWRIFPHFRDKTAYLDIETTGLSESCDITTIALYDGHTIKHYIQGENLDDFTVDISRYDVLVSYNGKSFDVPVIERFFDITLDMAHIDLRYVLNGLGLKGGLKGCEKQLGLSRGELDGVNGYMAVLLWNFYQKSGERRALETLLAYNIMDTVNLELLMVVAYNRNLAKTPFQKDLTLPTPKQPAVPFTPDPELIARLSNTSTGNPWQRRY